MEKFIKIAVGVAIAASTLVVFFSFMYLWIRATEDYGFFAGLIGLVPAGWAAVCYEYGCLIFAGRCYPALCEN